MSLTAEQSARLAEIDAILASGVRESAGDGVRVLYDLDSLRLERDELRALNVSTKIGSRFRRVVLTNG